MSGASSTPALSRLRTVRFGQSTPIALATIALFVVSPLVVPGSLGAGPLATMLPFAAILGVAAMGQTLVIQQRGVDFSVAATMSLTSVLLAKTADGQGAELPLAFLLVFSAAVAIGGLNAFLVTTMKVTPIIATLGVNSLVLGVVQAITGGASVPQAPAELRSIALGRPLGIPSPVIVVVLILAIGTMVLQMTTAGRRFEAVGFNPDAARLAGLRVTTTVASAYIGASLLYAAAGVMLASFVSAPEIDGGDPYLLASIAATVLGGTALSGGTGSLVGAVLGALFLTQLDQLLLASGLATPVTLVVQGAVIAASLAVRTTATAWSRNKRRRIALAALQKDRTTVMVKGK